jgi:hypothetical protein
MSDPAESGRDPQGGSAGGRPEVFDLVSGHFTAGSPALRIGPALTRARFQAAPLFAGAEDFVGGEPDRSWKLARLAIGGLPFCAVLRFEGERLARVELMHDAPELGSTWDDWSPALELERKARHDAWLAAVFGERREFPWGSVAQVKDPHYGTFEIVLRYRA